MLRRSFSAVAELLVCSSDVPMYLLGRGLTQYGKSGPILIILELSSVTY